MSFPLVGKKKVFQILRTMIWHLEQDTTGSWGPEKICYKRQVGDI